ncbi:hypothetical protein V6N11_035570 [Hibiscus sabdariffa]|uniref:Uncharacterized protein n=1 Tax=Hibiscus sabdariffa TaxID=183260 RepID=A0ABR2R184_9ROSI
MTSTKPPESPIFYEKEFSLHESGALKYGFPSSLRQRGIKYDLTFVIPIALLRGCLQLSWSFTRKDGSKASDPVSP